MKQLSAVVTDCTDRGRLRAPAMAQQGPPKDSAKRAAAIPADARPPKGMCRIWIDGVPAAQQPAATDCPTRREESVRPTRESCSATTSPTPRRPSRRDKPKLPPNIKGFTGAKPAPTPVLPTRPPE